MEIRKWKSKFVLEFSSFRLGSSSKWCPKVLLKDLRKHKTIPMLWDTAFDSEEDANEYAHNMINNYISSYLNNKL